MLQKKFHACTVFIQNEGRCSLHMGLAIRNYDSSSYIGIDTDREIITKT